MIPAIAKPHLFISYSRKDNEIAAYLYQFLSSAGFAVFYDKEKTLIGEKFAVQIIKELRRSDAVVAIVSRYSVESPWCQAELYLAQGLNKMIAPVRVGTDQILQPAPLDFFMKDINYVEVTGESTYSTAANQIQKQLTGMRRKAYLRNLTKVLLLLSIVALLILGWRFGIQTLNNRVKANQRQALIDRLKNSDLILSGDVVATYARQFAEDEDTIARLLLIQENAELPDNLRLNARLLSTALLAPRKPQNRWFFKNINWQNSNYEKGLLNDITFMQGVLKNINFRNTTFAGVIWNEAPSPGNAGLMLSGLKFDMCTFDAGRFGGTGAVSVDFINSKFRGTVFDVSGFSATHFYSNVSDQESSVITNEVAVFENCSIENCVKPADPKVLEIVQKDSEVRFTGVVFKDCTFRGLIRPTWFKNCVFINCVFPKSVTRSDLVSGDNTIENLYTSTVECS